jgi:hypothetical protein
MFFAINVYEKVAYVNMYYKKLRIIQNFPQMEAAKCMSQKTDSGNNTKQPSENVGFSECWKILVILAKLDIEGELSVLTFQDRWVTVVLSHNTS